MMIRLSLYREVFKIPARYVPFFLELGVSLSLVSEGRKAPEADGLSCFDGRFWRVASGARGG